MSATTYPELGKPSFKCPHCAANSQQDWFEICAQRLERSEPPSVPTIIDFKDALPAAEREGRKDVIVGIRRILAGRVFVGEQAQRHVAEVTNLWLSKCFACGDFAVWVHSQIAFPDFRLTHRPNDDMPDEIREDFSEASKILEHSPRGAAALLRLCVQKLCVYLGKPGNNLNADIASLVKDGLDRRIQEALDVVRVVGNNAVHPGEMDIRDDRKTVETLFSLVNLIADRLMSQPLRVGAVFDGLPPTAKAQIEKRDK